MKVGLFFGSFNPVHIGHLIIAQFIAENTAVDEVWFVVSPHNPLKKKSTLLNDRQRLHMVNLAIGNNPKLRASDIEFSLPQPSYTTNTLAHLHEKFPEKEFCLIMGADNLESFGKWKNHEHILSNTELFVYPRPGAKKSEFENHPNVHLVDAPFMDLSATAIREAVKNNKDASYMLPAGVWDYIQSCGFYK